jgi:hypothetical protein
MRWRALAFVFSKRKKKKKKRGERLRYGNERGAKEQYMETQREHGEVKCCQGEGSARTDRDNDKKY